MDAITDTNVYEPHQWKHSTIVAGVEWKTPSAPRLGRSSSRHAVGSMT